MRYEISDHVIGIINGAREEEFSLTALGGSCWKLAGYVTVTIAESRGIKVETYIAEAMVHVSETVVIRHCYESMRLNTHCIKTSFRGLVLRV
jgi:hypothetical protein